MQRTADMEHGGKAGAGSVLRRRLVVLGRDEAPPPPAPPRSPERVIAAAVSRAADRVHGLPMFFDRIESAHMNLAEIGEYLPEHALLSLVAGPGEAIGVVSISPGLLTSLIEMQAIGRVSSRSLAPRRPTVTDAAVCADFVDACLAELGAELAAMPGHAAVAGYRYASFIGDPRPLDLLLEDVPYRRVQLDLRAGDAGQRDGSLSFVLPLTQVESRMPGRALPAPPAVAPQLAADAPTPVPAAPVTEAADLGRAVRSSRVRLHGVLARRKLTLGQLRSLAPGQLLSLPRSCLDNATLESSTGQILARGRLGESAGCHALRLMGEGEAASGQQEGARAGQPTHGLASADRARTSPAVGTFAEALPLDLDAPDPFRSTASGEDDIRRAVRLSAQNQ